MAGLSREMIVTEAGVLWREYSDVLSNPENPVARKLKLDPKYREFEEDRGFSAIQLQLHQTKGSRSLFDFYRPLSREFGDDAILNLIPEFIGKNCIYMPDYVDEPRLIKSPFGRLPHRFFDSRGNYISHYVYYALSELPDIALLGWMSVDESEDPAVTEDDPRLQDMVKIDQEISMDAGYNYRAAIDPGHISYLNLLVRGINRGDYILDNPEILY